MIAYLVDAFTDRKFAGNRAGVVFDADELTTTEKQQIAAEIAASETAFVSTSEVADFKVEFFTPTTQIDFCGHATIATFYMLKETGRVFLTNGVCELTQETKSGILPVIITEKNGRTFVTMRQGEPRFARLKSSMEQLALALNVNANDLDSKYPPALANTANWHLIVGVSSKTVLDSMKYDATRLSEILSEHAAVTAHVFTEGGGGRFHARNFGPIIGIPEDPATGSAAGAFAAYLAREQKLAEGHNQLLITQGEAMGRLSEITISVELKNNEVQDLTVSGTAALSFSMCSEAVSGVKLLAL